MKLLINFITIILLLTIVLLYSCSKNILETEENNKTIKPYCFSERFSEYYRVLDSTLVFSSKDDFESFLSEIYEINDSILTAYMSESGIIPYKNIIYHDTVFRDLMLNSILNKNGIITIADTTYKVIYNNFQINVYCAYPSNPSNLRDLIELNFNNTSVRLIASNELLIDSTEIPLTFGGGEDCAPNKSIKDKKTKYIVNNTTYRIKAKQLYVDAFFYKELSVKLKSDKKTTTGTWQDQIIPYVGIQSCYKYKPRNKDYSLGNAYQQTTNAKDIKLTIYASTRCLSKYFVDSTVFFVKYGDPYNFQTTPNSLHLDALFYNLDTCF